MSYITRSGHLKKGKGFTLIEILVALVVLMVGLAALLQLQASFITGASDSEKRAVGMALAEKKLEEFRDFQSIAEYDRIGSAAFPTSDTETVSVGNSSMDYTLDWAGINTVSSAVNASEYKEITVRVSWDAGSLALSTILARIDPGVGALLGVSGIGGGTPEVSHAPGTIPDVIPIELGNGNIKETSKPLPEIAKKNQGNESTEVKFSTTTYDTSSNKQIQEEFITVNCFCQLESGNGVALQTPYHYEYLNGELVVKKGVYYTGGANDRTGSPVSDMDQSQYCTRCCAGHHDAATVNIYTLNGVPGFKETSPSSAHAHYALDKDELLAKNPATPAVVFTGAEAVSDDFYPEACRFRRVDGIFRLFPDWKMVALNVMLPEFIDDTASSALSDYQDYVVDEIWYQVFGSPSAAMPSGRDFTANNAEKKQLLSRSIYYDDMTYDSAWNSYIASIAAGTVASQGWLSVVPFFEINTTLLTTWTSSSATVAAVTNEVTKTIQDDEALYYDNVYSRGAVTMAVSGTGSAAITAYSKTDNTGLLSNVYDNASNFPGQDNKIVPSPATLSDTINATISCVGPCPVTISGTISTSTDGNLNKVSVLPADNCTMLDTVGNVRGYNCEWPAGTVSTTVTIEPTITGGSTFDPPSLLVTIDEFGTSVTDINFVLIK
ncbi:type IV pilus modification PilV family protein [Marinobacterium sp. YM272]|uniref:type IV pilus modification PilV family protein n=1 Tax=Marinobacterium sp. YM272 TaxID=3421654 RepID=UPI003D7FAD00